ncbi:flagellar hook-length control protein FliK [Bacillota bacterium Meth-B3]
MVSKVNPLPIRPPTATNGTEAACEPEAGFGAAVDQAFSRIRPSRAKGAKPGDAARDGDEPGAQAAQAGLIASAACQAYLAALTAQPMAKPPEVAEQPAEVVAQGTAAPAQQDVSAVAVPSAEAGAMPIGVQAAAQPAERRAAFELPSDIAHTAERPEARQTPQASRAVSVEPMATPVEAAARAAAQVPVEAARAVPLEAAQAVPVEADTAKSAPAAPEAEPIAGRAPEEPARAHRSRAAKADAPHQARAERAQRDEEVPQAGRALPASGRAEPDVAQAARAAPAQGARAAAEPDAAAQVARSIPSALRRGETQYRLRLRPEGLGEVEVSISARERTLGLTIRTANEDARALIASQLGELRRELVASNYELGNVNIEVSANGQNGAAFSAFAEQGRRDAQPGFTGASSGAGGMEGDAELRQIREAYARAGAIMYRI